ncbi:unnamed protein product, partial [Mesorhabditis spiculigera]
MAAPDLYKRSPHRDANSRLRFISVGFYYERASKTMSVKVLATLASVGSAVVLVSAVVSLGYLYNDINSFYYEAVSDMSEFQLYANDAWSNMITSMGQASSSQSQLNTIFGRHKRSADKCQCGPQAKSCPAGPPGPPGQPGQPGDDGEKGKPGNTGIKGSAITQEDTPTGCIKCPQGPPGPKGPDGAAGDAGKNGEKGKDGEPGKAGENGTKGKGAPGPLGPMGPIGPQGNQGAVGTPGQPGKDGQPGAAGQAGKDGDKGKDGEAGGKVRRNICRSGLDSSPINSTQELSVESENDRGIKRPKQSF